MAIYIGTDGNDTLIGGDEDDELIGGLGDDTLTGGKGFDWAYYDSAPSAVVVNLFTGIASGGDGNDTLSEIEGIIGSDYDDTLTGNDNSNQLWGGIGNDLIEGRNGNDYLRGNEGDDTLIGGGNGKGFDWVYYDSSPSAVVVNLSTGNASGGDGNDTLSGIEAVIGSNYDDTLIGNDNYSNELWGGDGNDLIEGGNGNDNLIGGAGNDQLEGGNGGSDNLVGDIGDDLLIAGKEGSVLTGGLGNDALQGGRGFDWAHYDSAPSSVVINLSTGIASGGDGYDTLIKIEGVTGSNYDDTLIGGKNDNQLLGGVGNDLIDGVDGDDYLWGGKGDDILLGGKGNDIYSLDDVDDQVIENNKAGTDTIQTEIDVGWSELIPNIENLTLIGVSDLEANGNSLSNILTGNVGANVLDGKFGNDTLKGLDGADYLIGGEGADKFRFENIFESGIGLGNRDIVADFFREQKDKIDISLIDAKLATSKNDAFTWKGTAAFTHIAGELRYIIDGGSTLIEGDIDGDGSSDFQIELIGNFELVSKDFVL